MREFLSQNREIIIAAASIVLSLLVDGCVGLGIALGISRRRIRELTRQGYQIRCPRCKKEFPLEEAHFLMASGELDDNLNGIPDNLESH